MSFGWKINSTANILGSSSITVHIEIPPFYDRQPPF
jgi:hypothetical protein